MTDPAGIPSPHGRWMFYDRNGVPIKADEEHEIEHGGQPREERRQ